MATPRQRACVALLLASALCAACGSNEATQGPEPDVAGDVLAADADVRPADVPADAAPDASQVDVHTPTECLTGQFCGGSWYEPPAFGRPPPFGQQLRLV